MKEILLSIKNIKRGTSTQSITKIDFSKRLISALFALILFLAAPAMLQAQSNCLGADPFCTGTTYDFPMGVSSGSGEVGPNYGCLYSTPNPIWYYLQVATAGPIELYMYGSAGADIDFVCWGPFASPTAPCVAQLTGGASTPTHSVPGASASYPSANMIDCSYDSQDQEWCYIPNAQVGEYYIIMITNYSNVAQNVVFSQTGGTGTTNCGIVAPPITNNGPLCVGQTLQLTVSNPVGGATYAWTGPNGFTSNAMNPTITNVTAAMAGTYSLVITVGGNNSAPVTTTVVINPILTPSFNQIATVCQGDVAPLLPTTSLNTVTGTWSPAVISTAAVGSATYTFTPDVGQCATTATMTVDIINCSVAAPCPDYSNSVASLNQHCSNQIYYFEVENTACNGFISFNVVGNWGSSYSDELTWEVTSNLTGAIIIQDNNAANNIDGGNINVASGAINPNIQGFVYTLTIYDSYGDGFNGTGGYIVVQQGGVNVCSQITGNFGAEAHNMFMPNVSISPATITITTPGGPVTQTVTNCRDFLVPVPINNALFCTTANISLPWQVTCEADGSLLANGTYAMTIYPKTPTSMDDIVDISFDQASCSWVSNWQNDCNLSHLGSVFTITPDPTAPANACEAHYPETFTMQYNGIPSGLPCCNTAGPSTPLTYITSTGTSSAVASTSPFFATSNHAAYLTIPPNGSGGGATAITLNFDMTGYCFNPPGVATTDFWVTIIVDGVVVYDQIYASPATSASVTLDLTDIPFYDENSVVEVYVYPNTFTSGGINTVFLPGVSCASLSDGRWTAAYFNLSVDVTFSELIPTPGVCSYDANENKPCCATTTTADVSQTICSGEAFSYAAWQSAVTAANSTCLVFSSDTPAGGVYLPDNIFPNGINATASPIVQTVAAYAYCDMNGSGAVDAGDLYTLLSTYTLTVNPSVTPTFTALGPYCTGDTPGTLPTTSLEGITGSWSPATISTAAGATTVHTFTPDAGQCATSTTMSVVVNVCCPTISCPADIVISSCNQPLPAGASTLVDFVNLGGTISNATGVSFSDATVNGCSTVTTRTYTASNASACTATCTQTITRTIDVTAPTANALTALTFACPASVTAANINDVTGELDACSSVTVAHVSDGVVPTCNGSFIRTYSLTDACGNSANITQNITISAPVVTMPAAGALTVACIANATVPTSPVVTDNCGRTLTVGAVATGGTYAGCEGTRTYTYPYTDCSGASYSWTYTYTIEVLDFSLPVNGGSTVNCPAETNTVPTPPAVTDNCGNSIAPTGPVVSALPAGAGTRTYTWTYTDCEGNTHNWVYTYTVTAAGVIVPTFGGSTVNCPAATNTIPTPPTIYDQCCLIMVPTGPIVTTIPTCEGTRTYTWTYTDCGGGTHTWDYVYTVDMPDFTMPANGGSTVSCPSATNTAPSLPVVTDFCGNTITPSAPVISAIPTCEGTRTYTYTYTDCALNTHNWVYTYTVEFNDFAMPANGGSTVNCPALTNTAPTAPVVTDNCGNTITPSAPVVSAIPTCESTRTYTYTYTDCEGNSHNWVYTYTVEFDDFSMPNNAGSTVNCPSATNTAPTLPTVIDNCGNTLTPSAPVISAIPTCESTRTYTYTYTDCEGNAHNWVYTYTVDYLDFTLPANGTGTVNCIAETDIVPTPPVVTDFCGVALTPAAPTVNTITNCNEIRVYTFPYTDCAGNSHDWTFTYSIVSDAPTITYCPVNETFCFNTAGTYAISQITATDDCVGALDYSFSITGATTRAGTGPNASGSFSVGTSVIDWTVTDACGIASTCQTTVVIEPLPVVAFVAGPLTGCDPTTVNFTDQSTGNITIWDWQFGDGNFSNQQNPSNTYSAGTYSVTLTVTSSNGCQSSLTMSNYIAIMANPVASFIAVPNVASEDNPVIQFINSSSNASIYEWEFGDGGTGSVVQNPTYTYETAGEYVVTLWVENAAGCKDSTSMVVTIKPTFTFYLPNTFTPNSDGSNELFRPYGIGWDTDTYEMRIYNRWGELVFMTSDINHGWDGNEPKGTPAQEGVYSVKIFIHALDGKDHYYVQALHLIR